MRRTDTNSLAIHEVFDRCSDGCCREGGWPYPNPSTPSTGAGSRCREWRLVSFPLGRERYKLASRRQVGREAWCCSRFSGLIYTPEDEGIPHWSGRRLEWHYCATISRISWSRQ